MQERNLYIWGAISGITGAIVGAMSNAIHPRVTEYGNQYTEAHIAQVAASTSWIIIHIALLFAILLIGVSFIAFARSMRDAGGFQHLAMASAVAGGVVGLVTLGVDGYAAKSMSDAWAASLDDTALAAATAVTSVGWGLFMVLIFSLFGSAVFFAGLAITSGSTYPRWFGWAGIVVGLVSFFAAAWGTASGPSAAWFAIYLPLSMIASLWALVAAGLLWRHAQVKAMAPVRP